MLTAKSRARVRLEGAKQLARNVPAAAVHAAVRSGHDLQGAVVTFDAVAGAVIGLLDIMSECAGVPLERAQEVFAIPDWSKVAEQAGESPPDGDRMRALIANSRARLGFSGQTYLSASEEQ